jgi:Haem-binding uptake, Tiki superfamily, ChaN
MVVFRTYLLRASMPIALVLLLVPAAEAQRRYVGVVEQILDAWKTADVVCLGEDHDRYYDNELRMALIQHPAFPRTVRVIVVELANSVHQDLLDRFILDGATMSREELAPIWRDATNPEVWESPIYEQLLRAIQEVNLRLPRDQRVRVLAGDSKVDWSKITRPEELIPLMNRGGNIRDIIATQVLDAHLKALAIYGAGHCNKLGTGFPGELAGRYGKERMWSISPLIRTAGTEKGRAVFGLAAEPAYIVVANSRWSATPAADMLTPALARFEMGRVYDAIVYHGDVPDRVVGPDMAAFRARMGQELDRRAKILADAVKLRQQRP